MNELADARHFRNFADLTRHQHRGRDFEITTRRKLGSPIAIVAPHGGGIEDGSSQIARAIAGHDFNLYLFEGIRPSRNYHALHLTSHRFDEPDCLSLIKHCPLVITIHGCGGADDCVFIGGLDDALKQHIAQALRRAHLPAQTEGHRFPAVNPLNICNRGASNKGVQLEITHALRRDFGAVRLAATLRHMLLSLPIINTQPAAARHQHAGG
jgi:phage replication-related protein YjqB (UPF0714/DUF867 family)